MNIFKIVTPFIYWSIIIIWFYIFVFYLRKFIFFKKSDKFLKLLLIILAIDAFRTLFESLYFGAWFTSLSEILPLSVYNYLSQPQIVFFPKLFNLIVSILILVIIIRKWLPEEADRIKNFEEGIASRTKELRESSANLRSLLDNRDDYIWSLDCDYNFIIFNKSYAKMMLDVYDIKLKKGINALKTQPPEIIEFWESKYEPVFRGENSCFEFAHTLNGNDQYLQVTLNPIITDGIVTGASAFSVDITETKKNQIKILESEKQFSSLIEQSGDAMFLSDFDGNIINVNRRACEFLGYKRSELLNLNIVDIDVNYATNDDQKEVWNNILPEESNSLETQHKRKNGEIIDVEVSFGLYEYANKKAVLGFARDITERKATEIELEKHRNNLEDIVKERTESLAQSQMALLNLVDDLNSQSLELEKTNAQFAALNKELESFSYSVSHDLRAPLRGIDGFSLALLEDYGDVLDDEGKGYLNRVRNGTQKMALLIDDMLSLSRLGRMALKPTTINLSEIAQSISADLRVPDPQRPVAFIIAKDISCMADPTLMRAVLQNLLENAWKFTSKKAKSKIEFGTLDIEGNRTYFVKDNGAGFNMEYKNKLFTPFQRLHQESEFPGTGIGLTTVQRIINRHSGKLWAEGEIDEGATFYFTLNL